MQKKKSNGTLLGLSIAGCIVVVATILWFTPWVHLDNSPKPLGDKLEFIGKFDYGCGGFIGMCDAAPGAAYYYATDMNVEEVVGYFRGARLIEKPSKESYSEEKGAQYRLNFTNKSIPHKGFSLNYYDNSLYTVKIYNLQSTNKNFIIEIDFTAYQNAKDTL